MRGNSQALFGKRPTEKDPAKGTSPTVDFTLEGAGAQQCAPATRQDGCVRHRAGRRVSYLDPRASWAYGPGVRRAGLAKAEPGADAGPAAPQAPP